MILFHFFNEKKIFFNVFFLIYYFNFEYREILLLS